VSFWRCAPSTSRLSHGPCHFCSCHPFPHRASCRADADAGDVVRRDNRGPGGRIRFTSGAARDPPPTGSRSDRRAEHDHRPRIPMNEEDFADRVSVTPSVEGALVRVRGRTPEEARRIAQVLRSAVSQAAVRETDVQLFLASERVSGLGFLDQVIDSLPGAFPRRNGPAGVGFAGFVASVIVCAGLLLFRDPLDRAPKSGKARDVLSRARQSARS
jgi:hypothetical protein